MDPDSLVATRARRANAGSRLKQLIEIEEQATGVSSIVYSEEDENVQLLFKEDENDEEFEDSAGSDENEENGESEDEVLAGEAPEIIDSTENKASDTESVVNSDEMLSDSDLSASENDDSEGERELQKTEKLKKRRAKPSSIIPAIKKPKLASEKPKPKPKPKAKHSELLLNLDRRASSRKSAMRNKAILVQKLKEDETRRAALAPVIRVDEKKLTQEERLAQAVETEKENVLSLHSFLEQEIVKKEHQKLLFQQRRLKLRNVVRLLSRETFVAPIDEIEDARHVIDLFDKKKKGKRRKPGADVLEDPRPGDVDTQLPYYRREMEENRLREEQEKNERERLERLEKEREAEGLKADEKTASLDEQEKGENAVESKDLAGEEVPEKEDPESASENSIVREQEDGSAMDIVAGEPGVSGGSGGSHTEENEENNEEKEEAEKPEPPAPETENDIQESEAVPETEDSRLDTAMDTEENEVSISTEDKEVPISTEDKEVPTDEKEETKEAENLETNPNTSSKEHTPAEEKRVTFADSEPETEEHQLDANSVPAEEDPIEEEPESATWYRPAKDGSIYEGPVQQVGRNDVILLHFDDEYPYLTDAKVKAVLFGKEANLGPSRRFRDVKTILKSSIRSDNPYATPKEETENELLKPVTEITEDDAIFEALKRLPRLGVKETFEEEEQDVQKEETTEIQIRTEAPSGLYLPNGNKKLCLITGKEARYFDPATGLPYENKDVYKVIKTIESGLIPWYSIGKDQNTYGEIQIYLNHREGARHARGVPEGFDGC